MALKKEEVYRKILHLFSGIIIPGLIFYIPRFIPRDASILFGFPPQWYAPALAALFAAAFVGVDVIRFNVPAVQNMFYLIAGSTMRPEERREMTGATYIAISTMICAIVFVKQPYISFMALCAFIWGDALAALVGQSVGRIKIGKKSLEGSLGCYALCLVLFLAGFPFIPHLLDAWNGHVPLPVAILAATSITVQELFPIKIKTFTVNDNLTVPVFTGIILMIAYPLLSK
jgi:dolichol kinase